MGVGEKADAQGVRLFFGSFAALADFAEMNPETPVIPAVDRKDLRVIFMVEGQCLRFGMKRSAHGESKSMRVVGAPDGRPVERFSSITARWLTD